MTPEERDELRRLEEAAHKRHAATCRWHRQECCDCGVDDLDAAECTLDDEEAAHAETLQMLDAANAEIERLRAALQQVADTPRATSITTARSIARKALRRPHDRQPRFQVPAASRAGDGGTQD